MSSAVDYEVKLMRHPQLIIVDDDDDVRAALLALVQEAMPHAYIADHSACSPALE